MDKIWIGVDNGVTGTIGIISTNDSPEFLHTPSVEMQDYCRAKKNITRLDSKGFYNLLKSYKDKGTEILVCMERPMVNPKMFKASESALRCFEAQWAIIELLELPIMFIPSGDWQKVLLPTGIKGAPELKKASLQIGNRLFPQFKDDKHPDRDGILIAEWMKRSNL